MPGGDEDRAGQCRTERGAQVRHAARQPGDVALVGVREAGLHDVDRRGEHRADTDTHQEQSGQERQHAGVLPDQQQEQQHAHGGDAEADLDQPALGMPPGEPFRRGRGGQDPDGGRGEHQPGLDGVVPAHLLQEHRDDEERALQDEPLDGLGTEAEVGRAVTEQPQRQQRFPAVALARPDVPEEPREDHRADADEQPHGGDAALGDQHRAADGEVLAGAEPAVGAGLQDAEYHEEQAQRGQHRAGHVERRSRAGDPRIDDPPGERDDRRHDHDLQHERRPPAEGTGDDAADQRPGRRA